MAIGRWFLRCLPGLSILLLLLLLENALGVGRALYTRLHHQQPGRPLINPVLTQVIFSAYTLFLHLLALTFPLRLAYAARSATVGIRQNHERAGPLLGPGGRAAKMVIVIPAYKETLDTMRETLDVLACHQDANTTYDVFLAMEDRDPTAIATAKQLTSEYMSRFCDVQATFHPSDIPGESAGKSSNVSWAAQAVMAKYNGNSNVLVTVMDSDSHLLQQYFRYVSESYATLRQQSLESSFVLYVPPIVFDRNAHTVPLLVRVADLMWSGAGLSCYGRGRPNTHLAIPTSVYTLSLPLVQQANGWDAGPDAIGEDMHMMLKCYFATKGTLHIESVPSPASSSNISVPKRGLRGYILHHNARYKQALRHMWGCLDAGFAAHKWLRMDCSSPLSGSPQTSPLLGPAKLPQVRTRKLSDPRAPYQPPRTPRRFTLRNLSLCLRIIEAHCLPAHLPLILLGSALYTSLPSDSSTDTWLWLDLVLDVTAYCRFIGFISMICYFAFIYEPYHTTCLEVREREMKRAGLFNEHDSASTDISFSRRGRKLYDPRRWIEYAVFPVAGMIFGAVPLLQASVMHFWTVELGYVVSAKPVRALIGSSPAAALGLGTGVSAA